MPTLRCLARSVVTVSAIALLSLANGCSKPAATAKADDAPVAEAHASTTSKLGDLSSFHSIFAEVAATLDKGDLPAAKARIKDLEMAWDSAEAGLKPRAAGDWHILDKAIDQALRALYADVPGQADCKQAMVNVVQTMNKLSAAN